MKTKHSTSHYLITGILTVIPISLTWIVFDFLFIQLSKIGTPLMMALAETLQKASPNLAKFILTLDPFVSSIFAVILTLLALYLLGWMATLVIGKRIIGLFDSFMEQVPFVKTIYGSTKKFLSALQTEPGSVQRVVLIEFPSPEMKTVGFVTRILTDDDTGQKLAAVYVPTTPNPTSGYLEIVPLDKITSTDWTMDEAMAFIISGGTIAPNSLNYDKKINV
ncbi:MAG: DUF502 domain-containing protein [Candidatus Marithrix sp.]